jgi:hypothetical protein
MRSIYAGFILSIIVLFFISACTDKYEAPSENIAKASSSGCVACHTDEDLLKEVADPLPPPSGGGGEG